MTLGNVYPCGYGRCQLLHCTCGVVILGLYFILLLVLHSRSVVSSTKLSLFADQHSPPSALAKLLRLRAVPPLCWMPYQVAFISFYRRLLTTHQVFLQLLTLKCQEGGKSTQRAGGGC